MCRHSFIKKEAIFMDVSTIAQLIGTLGFPIVATCALFWWNMKQEERHREEVKQLADAIENNTKALIVLSERLGDAKND